MKGIMIRRKTLWIVGTIAAMIFASLCRLAELPVYVSASKQGDMFSEIGEDMRKARLEEAIDNTLDWIRQQNGSDDTQNILTDNFLDMAGQSLGDWAAIAIGRMEISDNNEEYLAALQTYVEEKYQTEEKLDAQCATEWHRIALTVLALGGDPTSFGTDETGNPINLIADGTYNRGKTAALDTQGLNGPIYALLVLDSMDYEVPEDAYDTRESILLNILQRQQEDGGFALVAGDTDTDITAMALQALAPYYYSDKTYHYTLEVTGETVEHSVAEVIESALDCLSEIQTEDGSMVSWSSSNSESISQTILALCSLEINPLTDERFIKNDNTLLDALLAFEAKDGGFVHVFYDGEDTEADLLASEQALCALNAYIRYCEGKSGFFHFDIQQKGIKWNLIWMGIVLVVIFLFIVMLYLKRRKNK